MGDRQPRPSTGRWPAAGRRRALFAAVAGCAALLSATALAASPPGAGTVFGSVGLPAGKLPFAMYSFSFFGPTVFFIVQSSTRIGSGAFGNPSTGNCIQSATCFEH